MPPGPKPRPPESRFWALTALPDANGCMPWLGYIGAGGYGGFNAGVALGGMTTAHRFSYESAYGPIAPGLQVDHLCRVRECVAPLHLEAVPQVVNIRRGLAGRSRPSTCKRGHEFTTENTLVRSNGHRACRECGRTSSREYQRRKREQTAQTSQTYPIPRFPRWSPLTSEKEHAHMPKAEITYTEGRTERVLIPASYEDREISGEEQVVLTLSRREAIVLKKVTQRIGGNALRTDRGITESIGTELGSALGVYLVSDDEVRVSGQMMMLETEPEKDVEW